MNKMQKKNDDIIKTLRN